MEYPFLYLVSYTDPESGPGVARLPMAHPIATEQHLNDLTGHIGQQFAGGRQVVVTGYQLVADPRPDMVQRGLDYVLDDIAASTDTPEATLVRVTQMLRVLAGHQ